jgi:transposase-like protein
MTMKATTRRSFTDEFKQEAVSLLASSGRPLTQIATELDIQPSMLRSWRGTVDGAMPRVSGAAGPCNTVTCVARGFRSAVPRVRELDFASHAVRPVEHGEPESATALRGGASAECRRR